MSMRATSHITKIGLIKLEILFGIRARVYDLNKFNLSKTSRGLEFGLNMGERFHEKQKNKSMVE